MKKRKVYSPKESCLLPLLVTCPLWVIFWHLARWCDALALFFMLMLAAAPILAFAYTHKVLINIMVWLYPAHTTVAFTETYEERPGEPFGYSIHCLRFQLFAEAFGIDIADKDYQALQVGGHTALAIHYCERYPTLFYILI